MSGTSSLSASCLLSAFPARLPVRMVEKRAPSIVMDSTPVIPRRPRAAPDAAATEPLCRAASRRLSRWCGVLAALAAASLLASCATPTGLVPLEPPLPLNLEDDGELQNLRVAVAQSIRYYERLPESTRFVYGQAEYSPGELVQSHLLFLRTLQEAGDADERSRLIGQRFLVLESRAERNLFTGYFEPAISATEQPTALHQVPIYPRPTDLVEIHLREFGRSLPNERLVGRLVDGKVVPYHSREAIQAGAALDGQVEPIAWVNEVDLFFLQIQGSGRLRFSDGSELLVGYHGSNGHAYRSLGAVMIRREILKREEVTMQSIRHYLAEHPQEVRELLFTNPSYVFFRPLDEGPLGNIGVELTPGRSIAMDHRLVPRGALAYVQLDVPTPPVRSEEDAAPEGDAAPASETLRPYRRFMLVQDTGGAIRGHGRADLFLGHGEQAEWLAGHLRHPGRVFLLVARKAALAAQPTASPEKLLAATR